MVIFVISFYPIILLAQTEVKIIKVVTLIENSKINEIKDIVADHGLSLYIERDGQRILFDTGPSSQFIRNSEKLGVNIRKIDIVVISHRHTDHIDGLPYFLWMNKKANVFLGQNALKSQELRALYSKMDGKSFDRIHFVDNFTEIGRDIYILTEVKQIHPIRDYVDHEIILVIKNNNKLIIFTGCSHNEILNIIGTVMGIFPNILIKAVIGGFHFVGTTFNNEYERKDLIEQVGKEMLKYPIEKIYTCHCTGAENYKLLKTIMGMKLEYISTGSKIYLF